ncbi:Phosphoserine phosphatase [Durusdinium trenchii]|uniref:Chloroplastic n=1 Tax=Durusdinium trenchii TaxID=1381693 RepID=A0ABP0LDN1_9DINO
MSLGMPNMVQKNSWQNQRQFPGEDLLHSCQLCTILSAPLTTAIDALDNGVGAALASTREVVAEQLQGDNLAKLKDSMLSGTEPLVELKTLIHSAFGPFVEQDTMAQVSDLLGSVGTLASVALIGIALVLALCSSLVEMRPEKWSLSTWVLVA